MLLAGAGGLVAVWAAYWVAGPLFVVGAVIALLSPRPSAQGRETDSARVLSPNDDGGGRGYGGDVLIIGGTVLTARDTNLWDWDGRQVGYLARYTPATLIAVRDGRARVITESGRHGFVEACQLAPAE